MYKSISNLFICDNIHEFFTEFNQVLYFFNLQINKNTNISVSFLTRKNSSEAAYLNDIETHIDNMFRTSAVVTCSRVALERIAQIPTVQVVVSQVIVTSPTNQHHRSPRHRSPRNPSPMLQCHKHRSMTTCDSAAINVKRITLPPKMQDFVLKWFRLNIHW